MRKSESSDRELGYGGADPREKVGVVKEGRRSLGQVRGYQPAEQTRPTKAENLFCVTRLIGSMGFCVGTTQESTPEFTMVCGKCG